MDKQRFRIDKNEKLLALLEKRVPVVTNNYTTTEGNGTNAPQTIMGKPVIIDTNPRDGQALVYDGKEKEWKAGATLYLGTYTTATRPTLVLADRGKYIYDSDTQGIIFWLGAQWSDA